MFGVRRISGTRGQGNKTRVTITCENLKSGGHTHIFVSDEIGMKRFTLRGKSTRDERQTRVVEWTRAAFGDAEALGVQQRAIRLLEEAVELFQACDGDRNMAHDLVNYVFNQPTGEVGQEIGGVSVCILALAAAAGYSADAEEVREVERVIAKPLEHFRARNAAKNAAGFKARSDDEG